jgi:hypothetical protein
MIQLDHFIWGVPKLEAARHSFFEKSGIWPELGGQHPSIGSHNALISLEKAYFEFIAVDSSLPQSDHPFARELQSVREPRFLGWALQTDDFTRLRKILSRFELSLSNVAAGSRRTPEGQLIQYEYADLQGLEELGFIVPFVVRWIDSIHPSVTSPHGCQLKKFSITHASSPRFEDFLSYLNLGLNTIQGPSNGLSVELSTPKGIVKF